MKTRKPFTFLLLLAVLTYRSTLAQPQLATPFTVKANQPVAEVQPTMWGLFFEDINFGADGGLYAELVKNRSFEFDTPLMGWEEQKKGDGAGGVLILNRGEASPANPRYASVTANAANGAYGLANEGFRGMGIRKDAQYNFSMWARGSGEGALPVRVELVDSKGAVIGNASLAPAGNAWKQYTAALTATGTDPKAKLVVWLEGKGTLDLDMISLFPKDTWKGRPNGLRKDLVQMLADMQPGFLRFPGGCIVEGRELATRYQWKKTVGKVAEREMIINRWNTEFKHRSAPDYFQTFGLGFYEYFQLAEDIGAEPLPILNCGMACQFNTSEVVPVDQIDPFVQDALDLIEFANGAPDTQWGKLRAEMGHPAPFNLKLLGVGNEQWGPQYIDRYKVFEKAIKAKYPAVRLVTSAGPNPDGELFEYLDPALRALKVDIIDEHYYRSPDWFLKNAGRYDNYDRNGPKIFAGEYAAQSVGIASPDNKNNWQCALSEAAFMTGLERNAAVVHMASYAPLFAHAEGWQWAPDLIWFDNLRSHATPNYYVQKLFSTHKGSQVVPMLCGDTPATGQHGLYASAVLDKKNNELILKVVNTTERAQTGDITLEGVKKLDKKGSLIVLKSNQLEAVNSLEDPGKITPVEEVVSVKGKQVNLPLAPYSLSVFKIKVI